MYKFAHECKSVRIVDDVTRYVFMNDPYCQKHIIIDQIKSLLLSDSQKYRDSLTGQQVRQLRNNINTNWLLLEYAGIDKKMIYAEVKRTKFECSQSVKDWINKNTKGDK